MAFGLAAESSLRFQDFSVIVPFLHIIDNIRFTDDRLTGTGGAALPAEAARRLGLLPQLAEAVSVKRRTRRRSGA